jgi:uncharacterized protein YfbU (UPF0304 family)
MDNEKIKAFKQLYVATQQLFDKFEEVFELGIAEEQLIDQAIKQIDTLISMLPLTFSTPSLQYPDTCVLYINIKDAEDDPQEKVLQHDGWTEYSVPENTRTFYEATIRTVLEDWKFLLLNGVASMSTEPADRKKNIPRMLAQATHCMAAFPHKDHWQEWEKKMFVLYANQFGWFTYLEEQEADKLETALLIVEKGYELSDWSQLKYIKETKVRLLLKLERLNEAYPIVREAFKKDPGFADFQDLKTDAQYVAWLNAVEEKGKEAEGEAGNAYQAFLLLMGEEQAKVTNRFENPEHPLVIQHTALLNLIKQRILSIQLHVLYSKSGWKTADKAGLGDDFLLDKWSVERVAQFEATTGLRLPDELKVYLMEIGEGGSGYFCYGMISLIALADKKLLENTKKLFPLTPDNMDDIHRSISDGCLYLGSSYGQDPLLLIMNGVFEGEVWVDSLQYGEDAGGFLGPASAQSLKFLAFIAASLLAKQQGYTNVTEKGDWM